VCDIHISSSVSLLYSNVNTFRQVHRDVKSPNILLTDHSKSSSRAKLSDFNLSKIVTSGKKKIQPLHCETKEVLTYKDRKAMWERHLTTAIGTPAWMAPELLQSESEYGPAVDVYAFGIVMWECLEMSRPWLEFNDSKSIFDAVLSGKRPKLSEKNISNAPLEYVRLMRRCLDQDPKNRPPMGIVRFFSRCWSVSVFLSYDVHEHTTTL
jgi:serine/threonine protein kinase